MNVEITDNSKEVSGAIHQVGQAIADTGSLLQTWESLAQPEPNSTQPAHTRSGASSARQA